MKKLTSQQEKKLLSAAELVVNGDFAVIRKMIEFEDFVEEKEKNVKELSDSIQSEFLQSKEELAVAIERANSIENGLNGEQGEKGEDGESIVGPQGPIGPKGDSGEKGDEGKSGSAGIDGIDGNIKDLSPEEVRDTLELLKGDERLDSSAIKGLDKREEALSGTLINRAIGIVDQRSSYLVQKVAKLQDQVDRTSISTGGGHTIQDEGTPLTQRTNLNFVGTGVAVTDGGAGPDSTIVTINAGMGSGDVVGPASSTDGVVALFDGTTGKLLKNSLLQQKIVTSSGIITGGVLSIGSPTTKFSISDGTGILVNSTTGVATAVSWTGKTNITVTNIATQVATYVKIDSGGNVLQSSTVATTLDQLDYIVIGTLSHADLASVTGVISNVSPVINSAAQVKALAKSMGAFSISGNVFSANGANLSINKSAGTIYSSGANWTTDVKEPDIVTFASATAPTIFRALQNDTFTSSTFIDPNNYDLAGVLTAVGNNKWTIQHITIFPEGSMVFEYGQNLYSSFAAAQAVVQSETFITSASQATGIFRGYLIVKKGSTDLAADVAAGTAQFITAGKFGSSSGGTSSSTTTLQQAYDNSSVPLILTDVTRDGFSVQRGTAADTDFIYKGLNGVGGTTFTVSGAGNIVGTALQLSGLTASEIVLTDGSKNLVSAAVATYPSPTELTYVKGVTSAIQTQINTKANSAGALTQFVGNGNWKAFYSDGSGDVQELALGASGEFLKSNGAASAPSFATPAGSGDMILASAQTNSGIKTFLDTTMKLRNVANTFDGYFVNTNTADRIYTLKNASGTLAFTTDITGTNSGTNTGDQTTIVGITGTKAQFNTAVSDGDIVFLDSADTITGIKTFSPTARASGAASYLTVNSPADTGITAATESKGTNFTGSTRTWADGTVTTQREYFFGKPTYNKTTTAATFTTANTVSISGAPVAGTGVTITNPYALYVESGNVHIGAQLGGSPLAAVLGTGLEVADSNTTDGGEVIQVTNTSAGTNAYAGFNLNNDLANGSTYTNFAGLYYNSSGYTNTSFGTALAIANELALQNTDGRITYSAQKNGAEGFHNWLCRGTAVANEMMRLTSTELTVGLAGTISGKVNFAGSTSTFVSIVAPAVGNSAVLTLPATTGTIASTGSTTETSNATPTVAIAGISHIHTITALAAAAAFGVPTIAVGALSDVNELTIRIKDNATARALTWNAIFRASTDQGLPSTTVISKTMYLKFRYNFTDTKWDLVSVNNGF